MAFPDRLNNEYAAVLLFGNHFVPIHVKGNIKKFISIHPLTDLNSAQATANIFAKAHQIAYDDTIKKFSKPIITVIKRKEKWFAAEIHPSLIQPIEYAGSKKRNDAIEFARTIAFDKLTDFNPNIGISMSDKSSM